jgi:protein TonB
MPRDDWISLGASVGVHLALVGLFALLTAGQPETPALGAVQLNVGAFAEGRPVRQSDTPAADAPPADETEETTADEEATETARERPPEPAEEEPQREAAAAEETPESEASPEPATPVDLPEQPPTAGDDPPPEEPPTDASEQAPSPAPQETAETNEPAPSEETAEAEQEAGAPTGAAAGAAGGDDGDGSDEEQAAPFDIEGLDRTRLYGSLPEYSEKVEAKIKVEITVSPEGRVVGRRLVQKANPSLERSVLEALGRWRFNRLPSGAPQRNQTGTVTFRFRLE